MRILRDLGIVPQGSPPAPAGGHAVRAGVKHAFPAGFLSLLSTGLLSLAGKLEVARLLARIQSLDPAPLQSTTVDGWLAGLTRRREVRELLAALVRLATYGNASDQQSGGAALEQVQRARGQRALPRRRLAAAGRCAARSGARGRGDDLGERARRRGRAQRRRSGGARGAPRRRQHAELRGRDPRRATGGRGGSAVGSGTRQRRPLGRASDPAVRRLPRSRPRRLARAALDLRPRHRRAAVLLGALRRGAARARRRRALLHVAKYLDPSQPIDSARDQAELERLTDLVQPGWRTRVSRASCRAWR
jgi:hypothetical protein